MAGSLAEEMRKHAEALRPGAARTHPTEGELRRALMLVKRATLVRLRDERRIDDAVLRRRQETLDAEEVRLDLRDPATRGKTAP